MLALGFWKPRAAPLSWGWWARPPLALTAIKGCQPYWLHTRILGFPFQGQAGNTRRGRVGHLVLRMPYLQVKPVDSVSVTIMTESKASKIVLFLWWLRHTITIQLDEAQDPFDTENDIKSFFHNSCYFHHCYQQIITLKRPQMTYVSSLTLQLISYTDREQFTYLM